MLSPRFLINFVVGAAALYVAALVWLIAAAPYTGFDLAPNETGQMVVTRVDDVVGRAGLQPGDVITTLTASSGVQVVLNEGHYPASTVIARQFHETIAEHIQANNTMHAVLSGPAVRIERLDADPVELSLERDRPLSSVSQEVWYCIFLSVICWLAPALVWVWRPLDKDILYITISGLGLGAATISAATMYQIEMFYVAPPFFWLILQLVGFGNFAFVTFAAAAFLYFPQKLPKADLAAGLLFLVVGVYTAWVFLDGWQTDRPVSEQLLYFEYNEVYLVEVGVYALILLAVLVQGIYGRRNPVRRAEVLWIAFAAVMTPVAFFALYLVPVMLGYEALVSRTWTTTLLVIGFLLLATGVSRLRFLNLASHVGAVYQWTLVALLFVALDASLVVFLNVNPASSTVIMAGLLLFVYLPLRQWLLGRLSRMRLKKYESMFSDAADAMVEGALQERAADDVWPEVLERVFRPVSLDTVTGVQANMLRSQGQTLAVTATGFSSGYELQYADRGSRIFTRDDVDLVTSLQRLFVRLFDYRDGVAKGQLKERERIRRDLHDQVASNLLSLIYRAPDDESRQLATATMNQLREIMMAIRREPVEARQLIADLRSVCVESTRLVGLTANVEDQGQVDGVTVPSVLYLNALSILRELINNTVKYANASSVQLSLKVSERAVAMTYRDDGQGFDRDTVTRGNGLMNIQGRAEEMAARIRWDSENGGSVELVMPIVPNAESADRGILSSLS